MLTGDNLLLTLNGYQRIDSIEEPVVVLSECTSDGVFDTTHQIATITPRFMGPSLYSETASGKSVLSSTGGGGFIIDPTGFDRDRYTKQAQKWRGRWVTWSEIGDGKIVMSRETPFQAFTVHEDDWAFYTYGFTDVDDPVLAFPVPYPAATKEEMTFKKIAERRQEWPEWYWECTPAEKAMFLRGLYDAYGRPTKERFYFTAPNGEFSRMLVVALSEFGIKATRFLTRQILWKDRPVEYIVDIRGNAALNRMADTFYWAERARPSYRVDELHRHANRFFYEGRRYTGSRLRVQRRMPQTMLYQLLVNESHNAVVNGLIVHDDTAF